MRLFCDYSLAFSYFQASLLTLLKDAKTENVKTTKGWKNNVKSGMNNAKLVTSFLSQGCHSNI